ncbi:MAG: L-threonylcarbamoyladenylate synthase [Roseburia sp.]|nr:L-threonylcarbamoyladenylate synthase [Roseburia sp.]
METEIVRIQEEHIEEEALRRAGEILKKGGLVAFPTETVYGLGGDALNPDSARKIYAAKGRPSDNPLIIHICRFEDIYKITTHVPKEAKRLAEAYWPGPMTMILPKADCVPGETTGGLDTVAVRMPAHKTALKMIAYAGGYVAAPSANASGKPSPTLAKYVAEDMQGKIDMIIDGGTVGIGLESTIVDLTVSPPQILRPGYITQQMLSRVLGRVESDAASLSQESGKAPRAPGMKYRHYAPRGELTVVQGGEEEVISYINDCVGRDSSRGERTGVMATAETASRYRAEVVKCVGSRKDEEAIARHLYEILREFDAEQVTRIYSESFRTEGFGQAIMNRLLKAAGYKVVCL